MSHNANTVMLPFIHMVKSQPEAAAILVIKWTLIPTLNPSRYELGITKIDIFSLILGFSRQENIIFQDKVYKI